MKALPFISLIVTFSFVLSDVSEIAKESIDIFKDFTATDGLADKLLAAEKPIDAFKEFASSDLGKKISKTLTSSEETIIILTKIASSDIAKEWGSKLGKSFKKIAGFSKKYAKYTGPAADIIGFALEVSGEQQDESIEYLKNITEKLEKIYAKLDSISDQDLELHDLRRTDSSGSSTMKSLYDLYITTFMKILNTIIIQESVINLKTAITDEYYEEDRRFNHDRKNDLFKKFFASFEKAFNKLNSMDVDGFINFAQQNGNSKPVRMINVLQYFWENEDKLSIIDTCSDDCEHFQNRKYSGGGCNGAVKDCKYAVKIHHTERFLRQNPQVDRIYDGYVLNNKWYGYGIDDERDPNMELKKSYLRGFYNCHVCKCVCDQFSNTDTVRSIYTGKISAPDGYVVTGMRFVEEDQTIYPQIQVGKLLPMATVDQSSVTWLELPNDNSFYYFGYDKREILFGGSEMRFTDSVVTGVQFENIYSRGPSWSIYGRELVNFNAGQLGEESQIQTSDNLNSINCEYLIPGLDKDKMNSHSFTKKDNLIVAFGISNEESDAGQSFVPYFDGNDVSFTIKSPLSGISLIYYTNDDNYAGYIRPLLKSLDYKKYFSTSYRFDEFIPKNFTGEGF